jgi:hypothetical protein
MAKIYFERVSPTCFGFLLMLNVPLLHNSKFLMFKAFGNSYVYCWICFFLSLYIVEMLWVTARTK